MDLIKTAKTVAKKYHKEQFRDEGTPYYIHLENVGDRLLKLNEPINIIAIGYLHDLIEDTEKDYDYIKKKFNKEIADGVLTLSKEKNKADYNLESYLRKIIENKNEKLTLVKLFDRIDNINTIKLSIVPNKKERYILETENIFIPIFSESKFLQTEKYKIYFNELKENLEKAKVETII